ncbi:hypothetical protein LVD15_17610 [Fulvivirga maritima]|uniref:hypothetical protein n=1 Tax=Fulvivirga maritima TaxID=2904247 RepID=UPI001F386999|nr:hypothetical protein [Fulvivirga maritima]UII25114.1 hypothetical protein LVD15_17610 [Fulvivirga maritima]
MAKIVSKKAGLRRSKTIPEEYLAIIEENTEALQIDPSQWAQLVVTARQASTSFGYLPKKQYFIKPLDYERRFNQPAPYSDFIRLTGASADPQPDRPIKHYLDKEGRVCLIEYFYQGQVTYEIVYTYEPNRVTEYKKHHKEENLEKKNVLLLKEGKPEHFISYSEHFVRRSTFTLLNDTVAETQNSVLYIDLENKHCSESKSLDRFTYSAEGNLTKVGCYTENGEEIMTYEIEG